MEIFEYKGSGYMPVKDFESWRVAILNYNERFSKHDEDERHNETDEIFVLLKGSAILYEEGEEYNMEPYKVYNVKKGLWHHIVVSEDASVLIVENCDTTDENSEKRKLY